MNETERRIARTWYLVIAFPNTRCRRCGDRLEEGDVIAFRHADRSRLCVACAGAEGIHPRPSRRLLGWLDEHPAGAEVRAELRAELGVAFAGNGQPDLPVTAPAGDDAGGELPELPGNPFCVPGRHRREWFEQRMRGRR